MKVKAATFSSDNALIARGPRGGKGGDAGGLGEFASFGVQEVGAGESFAQVQGGASVAEWWAPAETKVGWSRLDDGETSGQMLEGGDALRVRWQPAGGGGGGGGIPEQGMNRHEVREVLQNLIRQRTELEEHSTNASTIIRKLEANWFGPDAQSFVAEWENRRRQWQDASASLTDLIKELRHQLQEQRRTSRA